MKLRLKFDFLTLELIEKRRKAEHKPSLGRETEERILGRHLRELECLAGKDSVNSKS